MSAVHAVASAICDLWPSWKPSAGMLALWDRLLADLDPKEVQLAVLLHASESPFPPTVADLRRLVFSERGADEAARKVATRKLLGLSMPRQGLAREDALDWTRNEPHRADFRAMLAERYAAQESEQGGATHGEEEG